MALSSLKRLDQKWLSIKNIFQKINILTTKNTAKKEGGENRAWRSIHFPKPSEHEVKKNY